MKFTIRKKLFLGFLSVLIILAATVTLGFMQIISVDKTYDNLINDKAKKLIMIQDLHVAIKEEQVNLRGYLILETDDYIDDYKDSHNQYQEMSKNLESMIKHEEAKELLAQLNEIESDYFQLGNQEIQLKQQGKSEEYLQLVNSQSRDTIKSFDQKAEELTNYQQNLLKSGEQDAHLKVESIKLGVLALGLIAVAIGIGVAFYMGHVISKPVAKVTEMADKIAKGDLTIKEIHVKNNDEIGELASSFNYMKDNLVDVMTNIRTNAEQVSASAQQLSASAEETTAASLQIGETMNRVSAGVNNQVHGVEETTQKINEMSFSVQQIANNSINMSARAVNASEKVLEGNQAIETAVHQMDSIDKSMTGLSDIVEGLGERSKEIGNITEVITGIAEQTNLLSLNAAIEAARAGEQGRGFAVVADEVRKLAEQSAQSAELISKLILTIQEETDRAVQSMGRTSKEVSSGMAAVNLAGEAFENTNASINDVTARIQEVSAEVQQMAKGTQQMAQSIQLINQVADSAAASTQEVAAAAQQQSISMKEVTQSANSLTNMAEELQHLIGRFNIS